MDMILSMIITVQYTLYKKIGIFPRRSDENYETELDKLKKNWISLCILKDKTHPFWTSDENRAV